MAEEIEQLKREIDELKSELREDNPKEKPREPVNYRNVLMILLVVVGVALLVASASLSLYMLSKNDWHLQKMVWWRYQPYVVTQSFFDEKLSIERQDGYNQGYGEGYSTGDLAGYNRGYYVGYSAGFSAKTCDAAGSNYADGYNDGQVAMKTRYDTYINENIDELCLKSQQEPNFLDYLNSVIPLVSLFL